jgi:hypothetical protein
MGILDGDYFSNYMMGKVSFNQNPFLKTLCGYEAPRGWCWNGEKENGGFDKTHIVSLYLRRSADTLCDHIYPHMGKGLVI